MKKEILILFMLLTLSSFVSAQYTLSFLVRDYNTKQPIQNANISIYHIDIAPPNQHIFIQTDSNGLAIEYNDQFEHWYNVSKPIYYTFYNGFVNVTNDTFIIVDMVPISTEGIVNVNWADDTIGYPNRRLCFYFEENGRLLDCFLKNDTIQLLNNHNYTMIPETNFFDLVGSIDSIWENKYNLLPYLGLVFFGLYMIIKVIKKK